MRSFQSILSALRAKTSQRPDTLCASWNQVYVCFRSQTHQLFVPYGINSVGSEAFTIKWLFEIKQTFHSYHHTQKWNALWQRILYLLLPALIICGSTSESIWLNWNRWLWNGRPFDRLNRYVWNHILANYSIHCIYMKLYNQFCIVTFLLAVK